MNIPSGLRTRERSSDELSLLLFLDILQYRWKFIFFFTLVPTLLVLSVLLSLPPRFEASALIRLAKVGNIPAAISGTGPVYSLVEPVSVVIARIETESFKSRLALEFRDIISIEVGGPKDGEFISIRVVSHSAGSAEAAALKAVNLLSEAHNERASAVRLLLEQALETAKRSEEQVSLLIKHTYQLAKQPGISDPKTAEALGENLERALVKQLGLNDRQVRLKLALSPLHSNKTEIIEAISPPAAISRGVLKYSSFTALLSCIFAISVVLVQQSRRSQTRVPTSIEIVDSPEA